MQALVGRAAELENLGFEIEEFGGAALKVSAVPALLSTENCSNALRALAEDLEGLDRGAHVQEALRRIAATTACHAAVKANYPLTRRKDDAHSRRTASHRLLNCLSARPPGHVLAADTARNRKEFRSHIEEPLPMSRTVFYLGRFGQLVGMWILLVDIFTAGPLGPSPRLFAVGVAVFLAGWGLTRRRCEGRQPAADRLSDSSGLAREVTADACTYRQSVLTRTGVIATTA